MDSFPKVLIIILNWNNYNDAKNCLQSLKQLDYPNYNVILVDNGSDDNSTKKFEKEFPKYTYIYNKENLGFAAGNNVGIKYALQKGADYIFLLNNDTIIPIENNFKEMIRFAEDNKKIGILGPRLIDKNGQDQKGQILSFKTKPSKVIIEAFGLHHILSKYLHFSYDKIQGVDYVIGAAFLVKKGVFKEIGLLDEQFFFYAEDNDFCLRARKKGWRVVYFPGAKIIHLGGESGGLKMLSYQYRATFQFLRKHYPPYFVIILKPIISFTSLARAVLGFSEYIFTKKQSKKNYMKQFFKLSFNIWKIN